MTLGDFDPGLVVYGKFTTYRPSTGAPYTLAGTPGLVVYKDGATTPSSAGVTLTVDFNGVVGLGHFAINTAADATFYAGGSSFDVVISAGTVDGVGAVGTVVGRFSLRKTSELRPTTAGRTLGVTSAGQAGVDWANVGGAAASVTLSGTTVGTATNLTTLPAIPANWLTAAGIAAGALDGKGDWLLAGGYTAPPTVAAIAARVWDEVNTGNTHNVNNSTGKQLRTTAGSASEVIYPLTGTVNLTAATATTCTLDPGASATAQAYRWDLLEVLGGTGSGQTRLITDYTAGRVATLLSPWTTIPDTSSTFQVYPAPRVKVVDYVPGQGPDTLVWQAPTRAITALPAVPANWLTAAGIAPAALDGKGDWLTAGAYTAPPTAAAIATQVDATLSASHGSGAWGGGTGSGYTPAEVAAAVWGLARSGNQLAGTFGEFVDAATSSRLAAAAYTAPPAVGAIATQVDATLSAAHGPGGWALGATAPAGWVDATSVAAGALDGKGDWLTAGAYTAPPTAAAIATQVDATLSAAHGSGPWGGGSVPTPGDVAAAVWGLARAGHQAAGTFGEFVDAATSSRLATAGYTAPPSAAAVATQVDATLSAAHGSGGWALGATAPANWLAGTSVAAGALNGKGDWLTAGAYTAPPSAGAIATQVDATLTTSHGSGGWALGSAAPVNWLNALAVAAGALNGKGDWLTAGAYTAPPTAAAIASQVDATLSASHGSGAWGGGTGAGYTPGDVAVAVWGLARSGNQLAGTFGEALDVAVGSRLATAAYTAPPTAAAIATQVDVTLTGAHGSGAWVLGATAPASWLAATSVAAGALAGKGDWLTAGSYVVPPTAGAIAAQVDAALTTAHGAGAWALGATAPANWIQSASITAGALNGKGDWLTSLGATAPAGWVAAASIAAGALDGKGDWLTAGSYTAPPAASAIAAQVDATLTTAHGAGAWALGATAPTGWLVAASFAPSALAGKGDWLTSLGPTAPTGWVVAASVAPFALNGKGDWLPAGSYVVPPTAAAIATQVDQALTTSHGSGGWALGSAAPVNWLTAASVAASALVGKGDWLTAGAYTAPPTAAAIATQVDQVLTTAHGAGGWALGATAPANWVAAASIAPGALDGKGDWLPAGALSFTVAGQVDANVRYVNGTQVVGDGQVGTEWGPAP